MEDPDIYIMMYVTCAEILEKISDLTSLERDSEYNQKNQLFHKNPQSNKWVVIKQNYCYCYIYILHLTLVKYNAQ